MPKGSKTKRAQQKNLLKNLSNLGKRAWDELSPKKLTKWLSPRKKQKENSTARKIVDATEAHSIVSDASWHNDASVNEDPFTAETVHSGAAVKSIDRRSDQCSELSTQLTPTKTNQI
ncbi:hypothetical protein C8F04DRAFT_1181989 [Mycena alexandri]|uniref:Uncharacterized protein n=1 Tax=Mycena alexandri TaxID=1745969 RepID=A0AAD6SXM9_9AGAR|nr:hypothetical protein C8F04DRAFT_1181989 [Mycena alexandri]